MVKLLIDAGHGGNDSGAVGRVLKEKDVTLKLSNYMHDYLKYCGVKVDLIRHTDIKVPLKIIRKIAETYDYFISLHVNSFADPSANGVETYTVNAPEFARVMQDALVESTGARDRGVKNTPFYVIRDTNTKSILLEVMFISNLNEELKLADDAFLRRVAIKLAKAYISFIGAEVKTHWAEKHFRSLNEKGITVNERRFDDLITRGEVMALLDRGTNGKD